MSELQDVLDVEKALTVQKLVQSIVSLEERNLHSEDIQDLLTEYVSQLRKELDVYSGFYETSFCVEKKE